MTDHIAVQQEVFGTLPDGRPVHRFTLTNNHGLRARVMDYGAILISMETPDSSGKIADLTHGFDTLDGWLNNPPYLGTTVGRFGNRIAQGRFSLDEIDYQLATNNEPAGIPCALHGGLIGFDKVLWTSEITADGKVVFRYLSKDGEEGYPGNLNVSVTYALNDDNELLWEASATTDAPLVLESLRQPRNHDSRSRTHPPRRPLPAHQSRHDPHWRDRSSRRHPDGFYPFHSHR
jgi:aldose 1-epimerase